MSLARQSVDVPIYAGTTDDKHPFVAVGPGNAAVRDARFTADGAIGKRFGIETPPSLAGLSTASDDEGGVHTLTTQGGRLVALAHDGAFGHDEVADAWVPMGRTGPRPSQARTDALIRGNNSLRHADIAVATVNGKTLALVTWHDLGEDAVFYAFFELPSDGRPAVQVSRPQQVSGDLVRFPKCAVAGTRFAIVGTDTTMTSVYGTSVDASSSYEMPAPSTIHSTAGAINASTLEFFASGSGVNGKYWIVNGHSTSTYIYRRKSDFTADGNTSISKANPMAAALVGSNVVIAHADGTVSRIVSDLSAGGTTAGPFLTPAATTRVHCATVVQADSTGRYFVAWSGDGCSVPDAGGLGNFGLDLVFFSSSHTGITQTVLGGVRLGGRACWDESTAKPCFPLINRQSNQPLTDTLSQFYAGHVARPVHTNEKGSAYLRLAPVCSYGIDTADLYQATFETNSATAGVIRNHLPSMRAVSAGRFVMPFHVYTSASRSLQRRQVDLLRLDTVGSASLRSVESQGVRIAAGGEVACVDGAVCAELQPPPPVYVDETTYDTSYSYGASDPRPAGVGGGFVPASFAYRWTDAAGNIHRSFVCLEIAATWTIQNAGTWYAARWVVPRPWPVALAQGVAPLQYQIEVYQSGGDGAAGGDSRYLVGIATPAAHPTLLGCDYIVPVFPAVATGAAHEIAIINSSAATMASAGYTQCWQDTSPSEYVPIPPPPFVDVCSTQSRVWGLSGEKGRLEVWPSKLLVEGYAPEFCPDLVVRVPAEGGECTAIAALDDKVIVFKERAIFVIFGDPGTNAGQRSTLQTPRLVSSDVGCSNPRSVLEGPLGVAFQAASDSESSRGGIHVIDRGLSVSFVGMPAKSITAGITVESAVLVPAEKEARWVLPDSSVLVWSYDLARWHTHTARARYSATLRRGRFVALTSSTTAAIDQDGWDHDGLVEFSTHEAQIETNWIKLAGLQGFQRVWTATFLFRWYTSAITIDAITDYNENWADASSRTWSESALDSLSVDGTGSRVQVSLHLPVQKCEAIRFRVTEDTANSSGRGFELVGLTLEAGVKRGSYRRNMTANARK